MRVRKGFEAKRWVHSWTELPTESIVAALQDLDLRSANPTCHGMRQLRADVIELICERYRSHCVLLRSILDTVLLKAAKPCAES
jgi:hypothetical protein